MATVHKHAASEEASSNAGLSSSFLEMGVSASFSDWGRCPLDLGSVGARSLSSLSMK